MSWNIKLDPADQAFSQYIRLRDRECLRCHSPVKFNDNGLPVSHHASHFQRRGKERTRFHELNVCTLSDDCHSYFTANPDEHYNWQVERLGQEVVDELILLSNTYCKKNRDMEKIYWRSKVAELL